MKAPAALLMLAGLAAACGPIPVEQAERQCADRAWNAVRPRGEIGFGIGAGGGRTISGAHVAVSGTSDYIQGRDPSEVYESCVVQRSGQVATRPLYERPEWRR